jgi:uncharacterized protein (DUF1778 family)
VKNLTLSRHLKGPVDAHADAHESHRELPTPTRLIHSRRWTQQRQNRLMISAAQLDPAHETHEPREPIRGHPGEARKAPLPKYPSHGCFRIICYAALPSAFGLIPDRGGTTLKCTSIRRTLRGMSGLAMKNERLALRVTARQKRVIERAAAAVGRNVTDFSVQTITERAEDILTNQPIFPVSQEAWDDFMIHLEAPARPVEELVALLHRPSLFDA